MSQNRRRESKPWSTLMVFIFLFVFYLTINQAK